ncbi:MAG: FtsX-like permease family protein [Anaerolineae bacterium]|jgi:putative ABC transport system permease protein|nr:FtsX-like permease family protein [Anaerolineae bacterium]MBT7071563.1 FtsX-like permease family protein [Anaerolineae bacterium]MBT7326806.1 FtsX-like permease family protein [Anaerolineae bacterium]
MNVWRSIIEALESLNANKMRSGLTMLGIVIGVAAVIAMLALGAGAQDTILGSLSGIGTNLLFVFSGGEDESIRNPEPLTIGDAEALEDSFSAPSIEAVAPVLQGSAEVSSSGEVSTVTLTGVTPAYFPVRNYTVVEGEEITEEHILGRASVVLLGVEVADNLFGRREGLVGETVRVEGQPFRVIGVLEERGGGMMGSQDNEILIPFSTAQARILRRSPADQVDVIFVQSVDADSVTTTEEEISQILSQRHRTAVGENDFSIFSQQDMVDTASSITGILTTFIGGIAAISLLVGGIGIMNIMLVSVTERTREIGLRKALGARKRDILIQFLTESSLLSLVGGLIGIVLGWGIGAVVGIVSTRSGTPFDPAVSLSAVLLATMFSTAIGLFFGIYPANRAANLVPVEALRYE